LERLKNASSVKTRDLLDSTFYTVDPASLEAGSRAAKSNKLERILKCLEGKKERPFSNDGHRGGLSNKEKLRKKNFLMVRRGKRSVFTKVNKSNSRSRWEKMHKVLSRK
jgi:hypothetical protein